MATSDEVIVFGRISGSRSSGAIEVLADKISDRRGHRVGWGNFLSFHFVNISQILWIMGSKGFSSQTVDILEKIFCIGVASDMTVVLKYSIQRILQLILCCCAASQCAK